MIEYHAALASAPLTESQNNQFLRPMVKLRIARSQILFERAMDSVFKMNLSKNHFKIEILNIRDFKGYGLTTELNDKFKRKNKIL